MITKIYSFTKENNTYEVYKLQNEQGAYAEILTYGARIHSLWVPDKTGKLLDVIVGCKTYEDYLSPNPTSARRLEDTATVSAVAVLP